MKARIIRKDVSRFEDGVRKGYGDIVNVTKSELKTGVYAPLRDNVKLYPKKDVEQNDNAEKEDKSE